MKKGLLYLLTLVLTLGILPPAGGEAVAPEVLDIAAGILALPTPDPDVALDLSELDETREGAGVTMDMPPEEAPVPDAEIMPEPLYVGIAQQNIAIRAWMSKEADAVGSISKDEKVYIVSYEPNWLYVVKGAEENWVSGYVLRHIVWDIVTFKAGEPAYGSIPATYSAIIGSDTMLHTAPDNTSEAFFTLKKGSKVAILEIEDGWAKVIYWRRYGYFYLGDATDLTPVYDLQTAQSDDALAAFISFYKLDDTELNRNRMDNIALACKNISIVMQPGDEFSFNGTAGPYQGKLGYKEGMSYFEGEAVPSYGGGVCQVSSTLYNVLLPLEGGIAVVYRRAHGPSGASYLPHGVDAAVGNVTLDLVFRNDYAFPIRIEASSQDGVLYIAILKA